MAILILDGHSRAALETLQSLGRAGETVDIAAEVIDVPAFRSRYANARLVQPPAYPSKIFIELLRDLDREHDYELIVVATEASLLAIRSLDENDPLRRKAQLPADEALDIALDKEKTRTLGEKLGLQVPHSRLIASEADMEEVTGTKFPLVLKPLRSKIVINDCLKTLAPEIIRDSAQRLRQLRKWLSLTPVIEQEYVTGQGVGVELLYEHGRKRWHFVHERIHEWPLTGGGSTYRRAMEPKCELIEKAQHLMDALNWHGVAMVEFKRTPDGGYCLMEINPRLWGSLALGIDAGVDFPRGLLALARGEDPGPQPSYRVGYTTRYLEGDTDWLAANLRADRADPLLMTLPRFRSFIELSRPLLGRESWDFFDWRDLGPTVNAFRRITGRRLSGLQNRFHEAALARGLRRRHRQLLQTPGITTRPVRRVLFVCYGNICRSPFGERWLAAQRPDLHVESTGFFEQTGRSTPEHVIAAARSQGIDLSDWRSGSISAEQVEAADLIVVMNRFNYKLLAHRFPDAVGRAVMLGLFASPSSVDIADPYRAGEAQARDTFAVMVDALEKLSAWLGPEKSVAPPGTHH